MFQDLDKLWGRSVAQSIAPLKELMGIQTKMFECLANQQLQCAHACLKTTMEQTQVLQSCVTPQELLSAQQHYIKTLEDAINQVTQANLDALAVAKLDLDNLTKDAFKLNG